MSRDRLSGGIVAGLGLAAAATANGFPSTTGQPIGPGLFPVVIGLALAVLGGWLATVTAQAAALPSAPSSDDGVEPTRWGQFVAVVLVLAVIPVVMPAVGFLITAALALVVLLRSFSVSWHLVGILSILVPLVLHYIFYSTLRVPLPWGLLAQVAW